MKEVKKLDVMSVAVVTCIIYAIIGLIFALFGGLFMSMIASVMPARGAMPMMGFSIGVLILYPIMFAILGFLGGALGAFVYNLVAKWVGGIKMEFVDLNNKIENQ